MEDDMQRFANLLADLITKYIDRLDLDSLPDPPPRPTAKDAVGVFFMHRYFFPCCSYKPLRNGGVK